MRLRYGKPILLLGFLASLYLEVSARFGGTSTSSSSSSSSSSGRSSGSNPTDPSFIVIGLGGVGLYLLYYSRIIRLKKEEAATVINNADDPLWTAETLQTTARNTFMAMQQAWTNRSMEEVLPMISQHILLLSCHNKFIQ